METLTYTNEYTRGFFPIKNDSIEYKPFITLLIITLRRFYMITKEHICSICYDKIIPEWNSTTENFPDFLPYYTPEEKTANETFLSSLIPELHNSIKAYRQHPSEESAQQLKEKLHHIIASENLIHIREHFSRELFAEFELNIELFLEKTKAFDKTLSTENIWQAMRNYLIYCMIVSLQDESQNCRDTILGYSLLYPYTDNYIDELHRQTQAKDSYNQLIRKTLMGEEITPANSYEEKTYQLLKLIQNSYSKDIPRQQNASSLLLFMLEAQEKSIYQIHKFGKKRLSTDDILRISTYKGGLSVLIDYLFSIDFDFSLITEKELSFYLSFGLILQLTDDLQDIIEDRKNHSQTLMSSSKNKKQLESVVNRLLHFTHFSIANFSPRNRVLHTFILQNCQLLLLCTVAKNAKYFSKEYLKKLEIYLPFSISFLDNIQKLK